MSPYVVIKAHLARHEDLDAVMLLGALIEALCDYHGEGPRGYGFRDPIDVHHAKSGDWTAQEEIDRHRSIMRRVHRTPSEPPASILEALYLSMQRHARENAAIARHQPDARRGNRYITDTTAVRTRADLARCQALVRSILAGCMVELEHEALKQRLREDQWYSHPSGP